MPSRSLLGAFVGDESTMRQMECGLEIRLMTEMMQTKPNEEGGPEELCGHHPSRAFAGSIKSSLFSLVTLTNFKAQSLNSPLG